MAVQVLIAEDDIRLRELIAHGLHQAGYNVTQAADGEAAIALLEQMREGGGLYDIVLTDIVMGNVNGIQVTQTARSLPAAPEVILLTGHGSLETAMESMRQGAFDYLLKPVRFPALLERISEAAAQRAERLRLLGQAEAWQRVATMVSETQDKPAATMLAAALGTPAPEAGSVSAATLPHQPEQRYLNVGRLRIDMRRHEVFFQDEQVHLTPIEYALLLCLAENPGTCVSYGVIAFQTHNTHLDEREAYSLLRTHVRNLRRKLNTQAIVSVRGVGFMLDDGIV